MHIAILCHEYPPIGGGAAAVVESLAQAYVANGHRVTIMTMGFEDLPGAVDQHGIRVIRVNCRRKRRDMASPVEGLHWAYRAWPLLSSLHAYEPIDVCHAHFIMPAGILASWMKRRFAVPFVVTPHGSDVPGYNRERLKLAHQFVAIWWRRICRSADRIISPSHSLHDLIHQATSECNSLVIPNGIASLRFKPQEKQKRMLLCSRLVERKGFHVFLEAVAPLDLPGWEVDLVGDGPMFERLSRLAKSSRVPVQMHGWIDNRDPRLAEMYGRALIFGLPSEQENFSIALLEGMSAGCAVVTTDTSGNPEVVGNTGVLVPPRDPVAIRSALLELAANEDRARRLGELAARRVVEHFTWPKVAARYLEQLQALAGDEEGVQCASA